MSVDKLMSQTTIGNLQKATEDLMRMQGAPAPTCTPTNSSNPLNEKLCYGSARARTSRDAKKKTIGTFQKKTDIQKATLPPLLKLLKPAIYVKFESENSGEGEHPPPAAGCDLLLEKGNGETRNPT